jgi:hypothetical protein
MKDEGSNFNFITTWIQDFLSIAKYFGSIKAFRKLDLAIFSKACQ